MLTLKEVRQSLHRIAELSGEEFKTAAFVVDFLKPLQPSALLTGLGKTGICASFDTGIPGPHLLFRAELDALPIQEINLFDYCSLHPGISHKCGHDGHTAILLGLARSLSGKMPAKGKVSLLFQPAEETGEGALSVLEDPAFAEVQPDQVFALHNIPGYPVGTLLLKEGSITAAVKSMIVHFHGKTSHAAEPEHGINPAKAIAQMVLALDSLNQAETSRSDFQLITPVHMSLGEIAYGVSAGYGSLHLTLRSWTNEQMDVLVASIEKLLQQTCSDENIDFTVAWTNLFEANSNEADLVHAITAVAKKMNLPLVYLQHPFKWGEDFGYFTRRFRGAFMGLGAGENCPALHNPDYDFPDELLEIGVTLFRDIVNETLG